MKLELRTQVTDSQQLRELASLFVEEFLNKVGVDLRPVVNLFFQEEQKEAHAAQQKVAEPIKSKIENGELLIHFSEKDLEGIPVLALQGWLDWELGSFLLALQTERFRYNYSKLIQPLFPLSGSAGNVVRDFVHRLESGLKSHLVTKIAIHADHAMAQFYFHFFRLHSDPEEVEDYCLFAPHSWSRLLFLADRLKEYMPVCLLDQQGVFPHLKSFWWSLHEFLAQKDRHMLEELAEIPVRFNGEPYPLQLLEMFKVSKVGFVDRCYPE